MPAHPTTRPARRVLALLAALTALVALVLPASGAAAGPVGTATANRITLDVKGLDLPAAPGSPALLLSADTSFAVTVTFSAGGVAVPYSTRTSTDVRVTTSAGRTLTTATVPAGQSSVRVDHLRLAAANGVTLEARAVGRKPAADLQHDTVGPFDVVLTANTVPIDPVERGSSLFVTATGAAEPCEATAEQPTCVDLVLPNGVDSDVFFSTGPCALAIGCADANGLVLQVLADLGTRYGNGAPATLIVRCDKSRCGGGAIQSNTLRVNLDPPYDPDDPSKDRALLALSPACGAKGVVDAGVEHCVDYVQSKRDFSGDTYLYLLITRDARMSH